MSRNRRQKRAPRQDRKRYYVATEGVTEELYLDALKRYLSAEGWTTQVDVQSVGKDPLKVVGACIRKRDLGAKKGRAYDAYICLVDVDTHASLIEALQLADQEGICVLVSNLKFEVWLRWHVEESRSLLSSKQLDNLMKKHEMLDGKRPAKNFPIQAVDLACRRAKLADTNMDVNRKGPNPSTAMPLLISFLTDGMTSAPPRSGSA